MTLLVRAPFRADLSEAFRICGTSEESLVLRDQTRVIVFGPPGEAVGKVNYRYRRLCSYEGIDRIDALVIGRIDEFSAERLEALDAITPIDRICVPSGTRESWKQALLDAFSERVLFYSETEELRIGGVCVRRLSDRAYLIETQNETICYTGSDLSNGILLSDGRTPPDPAAEDGILRIALG